MGAQHLSGDCRGTLPSVVLLEIYFSITRGLYKSKTKLYYRKFQASVLIICCCVKMYPGIKQLKTANIYCFPWFLGTRRQLRSVVHGSGSRSPLRLWSGC